MNFLITSGATREPIDDVRFITNFSTGRTGAALADFFHRKGAKITLLKGVSAEKPQTPVRVVDFSSFEDLDLALQTLLSKERFDAVFHLAAVGDFSVESVQVGDQRFAPSSLRKLDSSLPVSLSLKKNFKLVDRIKSYAQRGGAQAEAAPKVVAFKLTQRATAAERAEAVQKLSRTGAIDWVVHNDLSEIRSTEDHPFALYKDGQLTSRASSVLELAEHFYGLSQVNPSGRDPHATLGAQHDTHA
jgi:phosphopantothenoylcysteine synthetase/decarboxylase